MAETEIRRIMVPGLEAGTGPFSNVVLDGTYAFVSGVVASDVAGGAAADGDVAGGAAADGDVAGGAAAGGDVARETGIVMSAIRDALGHAGLGMDRIVRVDVHMTDIGRMAELDEVYAQFFPEGALPARTCTQSGGLAGGSNVEITVMARI